MYKVSELGGLSGFVGAFSFFSLELILRIIFCPSKLRFFLDPLHIIDFICITQDLIFVVLISTTSSTSVIGNGNGNNNNNNNGGSSGNNGGPAPPGGGPIAGGASLSSSTSKTIQKYNKILRFFYVLKIFRYFS